MSFNVHSLITDLNIKYQELKDTYDGSPAAKFLGFKLNSGANQLRAYGNEMFKNGGKDHEALKYYTKSIAYSETDSEELALAYSNRSAVFLRMHDYVSCLLDVNRALNSNYPMRLEQKLMDRKKHCLLQIRTSSSKNRMRGDETNPTKVTTSHEEEEWQSLCNFDNPLIPKASSKIKLDYDEKWGRHLTATEDINIGEILSVEEFFVTFVTAHGEHCSFCLTKCPASIPCLSCFRDMYCSEQCRTRAHDEYHRTECPLLPFLEKEKLMDNSSVAIRTFLIGTEQGTKLEFLMEKMSIRSIFEEKVHVGNKPYVSDYLSMLKLDRVFDPSRLKSYLDATVKTIIMLKRQSFFGKEDDQREGSWPEYMSEKELFAAALLINNLCTLKLKAFGVNCIVKSLNYGYTGSDEQVGGGICSLQHLISHSCCPNSRFFTRNREHVLYTCQPIKRGEKITAPLGSLYSISPLEERTEKLSSIFGVTCDCKACTNLWPLAPDLTECDIRFLVEDKDTVISNLLDFTDKFIREGIKHLRNADIVKIIIEFLGMLHKYVKQPSMHIVFCEDFLNKFTIMTFSEFGRDSARSARNEKYPQLMFQTMEDAIIHDCKEAELIDYAVFPHLRHVNPNTYMMF